MRTSSLLSLPKITGTDDVKVLMKKHNKYPNIFKKHHMPIPSTSGHTRLKMTIMAKMY